MVGRKTGTKEWAPNSRNIQLGCENDCRYCYAKSSALQRGSIKSAAEWKDPRFLHERIGEPPRRLGGRIMFPTTHDICPGNLQTCLLYLRGWLSTGNDVLIVSKPHIECVKEICARLGNYKEQITFRFTIGSFNEKVLKFWEPGAPSFLERYESLAYAKNAGFKTSVSCEPFLDDKVGDLFEMLLPFVTDTIWIGKMNDIKRRVDTRGWTPEDLSFLDKVKAAQTDSKILELYEALKDRPRIRWKDSIKHVVGLPEEAVG